MAIDLVTYKTIPKRYSRTVFHVGKNRLTHCWENDWIFAHLLSNHVWWTPKNWVSDLFTLNGNRFDHLLSDPKMISSNSSPCWKKSTHTLLTCFWQDFWSGSFILADKMNHKSKCSPAYFWWARSWNLAETGRSSNKCSFRGNGPNFTIFSQK